MILAARTTGEYVYISCVTQRAFTQNTPLDFASCFFRHDLQSQNSRTFQTSHNGHGAGPSREGALVARVPAAALSASPTPTRPFFSSHSSE